MALEGLFNTNPELHKQGAIKRSFSHSVLPPPPLCAKKRAPLPFLPPFWLAKVHRSRTCQKRPNFVDEVNMKDKREPLGRVSIEPEVRNTNEINSGYTAAPRISNVKGISCVPLVPPLLPQTSCEEMQNCECPVSKHESSLPPSSFVTDENHLHIARGNYSNVTRESSFKNTTNMGAFSSSNGTGEGRSEAASWNYKPPGQEEKSESSFRNSPTAHETKKERYHKNLENKQQKRKKLIKNIKNSLKGVAMGWGCSQQQPKCSYYLVEFFAGLVVAVCQLPMTISFAFIGNIPLVVALNGTWITCLVSTLLGGTPGAITDVTATTAAVIRGFLGEHCEDGKCEFENLENLFPSIILGGFITTLVGLFRLSRLNKLIPSSIMIGFCNGIAIINVKSQIEIFYDERTQMTKYEWGCIAAMIVIVVLVAELWPKIPQIGKRIPASLVALGVSIVIEYLIIRMFFSMKTKTIGTHSKIKGEDVWPVMPFFINPLFHNNLKNFTFTTDRFFTIIQIGLSLFSVIFTCSLVTCQMLQGEVDQQLVGVGVANMCSGFLGGMAGATGATRTALNKNSGGKGKESGLFAAVFMFIIVTKLHYVLNYIPIAGLSGLILSTACNTFKWWSIPLVVLSFIPSCIQNRVLSLRKKISRLDALVIVLTSTLTVLSDLGVALAAGLFFTVCGFAWKSLTKFDVYSHLNEKHDTKYYVTSGPLFFAAKKKFVNAFDIKNDPMRVVLFLREETRCLDYGCTEILKAVHKKYSDAGKTFIIKGMDCDCCMIRKKNGYFLEYAEYNTRAQFLYPIPVAKFIEPVMDDNSKVE